MKHTLFVFFLGLCYFLELPLGNAQLHVEGLLHIQGEALVFVEPDLVIATTDGIIENNGTIVAQGNITKEGTASYQSSNTQGERKVILSGDSPVQRITGDFTGLQSFYELSMNKEEGMVELNSHIEVSQVFNLVNGKLRTDIDSGTQASDYQYELFLSNPSPSSLDGNFTDASKNNFVEGRLRRKVSGLGTYSFPLGITENNPFFVSFTQAAELSDITASFERGTSTPIGMNFSCPNTSTTTVDCAIGRWNIQSTGSNYQYDISFSPSTNLLQDCPNTEAFFVSRNSSFDCNVDNNLSDGISSSLTGGFGLFDLPSADTDTAIANTDCLAPNSMVIPNGNGRVIVDWDAVPGAESYFFQVRIKGTDIWLVNFTTQRTRLFVTAPTRLQLEYRIQTNCAGGESDFSDIFEFNTRSNGNILSASSRHDIEVDIDISIFLNELSVFPNPIKDQFQVNYTPVSNAATLLVHHINGQLVHQSSITKDQAIHRIDAIKWEAGLYILSIKEKGKALINKKITKINTD